MSPSPPNQSTQTTPLCGVFNLTKQKSCDILHAVCDILHILIHLSRARSGENNGLLLKEKPIRSLVATGGKESVFCLA
jgi:hypothetical protein